jgi:hypothetical protein
MIPKTTGRVVGYGVIVLALVGTLGINCFTLAQVVRAKTSVPWADQWVMVQDLMRRERGEPLWPILWTPYWGHRLVLPRLLFLADARWLSFASLTWFTVLLQFVHIALLIGLAWMLLRRRSPVLFMIAVAVILNLMLSPFQMQNFVWGMQTMFPLVFLAATGAFLSLSVGGIASLAFCIALGFVASYTMPNGILVWPVLVVQAIYLKQNRKAAALALIGAVVIVSYLWHYTRPLEIGMGVGGILQHPINALLLVGLIVGSPFRLTIEADVLVGMMALFLSGYIFIKALFLPMHERKWFSGLFALILFLFLSSLTLVAGRLTQKDLHSPLIDLLPGSYFTMICLFWVSIALLVLSTSQGRRFRALLLVSMAALFVWLMFTSVIRQLIEAEDWADFFVGSDAVGSALLLDVPDEQMLSVLWPSETEREERTMFMRQRHLAMFHEPRAEWPGKRISDLFPSLPGRCVGAIEKTVGLDGWWRVEGWAWDIDTSSPPDDVLFTDASGRVIGLARGGLRHGYIIGFSADLQPPPPSHVGFRHSEYLGYVRQAGDSQIAQVSLYGLFRSQGKVCAIR